MKPDPRWTNAESFLKSLPTGGNAAELGVWRGLFARMSLDTIKPDVMYLVDWWAPYSNSGGSDDLWGGVQKQAFDRFKTEIKSGKAKVIEEDFVSAALHVPFDFFHYIRHDGDEREAQVSRVLRAWWPKLRKGGIWMGHGFDNEPWHGTIPALVKFLKSTEDAELIGLLKDCSHFVLRKKT